MADNSKKTADGGKVASGKVDWQARKLEKAKRDDTSVIFCRARDTGDYVNILNSNDNLVFQMRMNMGRRDSLTVEVVQSYIDRSRLIREEINAMNAEISKLLGFTFKPVRGYAHPSKKQDNQVEETADTTKDTSKK